VSVRVSDRDNGLAAYRKLIAHNAHVTVGIHEAEGSDPKLEPEHRAQEREQAKRFREAGREDTRAEKMSRKLANFKGTAKARAKLEAAVARARASREFMASRASGFAAGRAAASASGMSLIEVAEAHEFGLGVPQRSFVAGAVDENEVKLQAKLTAGLKASLKPGGRGPAQNLERFGLYVVGVMQRRISDGIEPELAESTKRQKKARTGEAKDTPLILTGQLRSAIRSKLVVDE
jgi:hypothetical protein